MALHDRRLRLAVSIVLGIPAALAALLLAALGLAQTQAGERWLARQLAAALASPEAPARVSGLDVAWPLDLHVAEIGLSDADGEWLTIHGLDLDWSPSRLAAATFAADHLTADRILVHRAPQAAEARPDDAAASGDLLPRLPVAIDIARLAADVALAEAVTGTPAELRVSGRAQAGARSADVQLALERTDAVAGRGAVLVGYDQADGLLAVDIDVPEPVGAVLTGLVPGAQLPPMALRVAGDGPLSDWNGTIFASTGGRPCIDATLRLDGRDALGVRIEGEALPQCLPPQVGQLIGTPPPGRQGALAPGVRLAQADAPAGREGSRLGEGAIRFRAEGSVGGGEIRIGEVEIDTPLGVLGFSGTLAGEDLSGRFALGAADVARLAAQAGVEMTGRAQLTGTVTGTRARPVIDAELDSPEGQAYGVAWTGLSARIGLRRAEGDGAWLVDAAGRLDAAQGLPAPLAGPLDLAVMGTVDQSRRSVHLANLRLEAGASALSLFGVLRDWGADAALHGTVTAGDLATVTAGAVTGGAVLHLAAHGDLLAPELRAAFAGQGRGLATSVAQVDALLGPAPRVHGTASLGPAATPRVSVRVAGHGATLHAAGRVGDRLAVGWRLAVPDLAAIPDQNLTGSASAAGLALGPTADPRLTALVRAEGSVPQLAEPVRAIGSVSLRDIAGTPAGVVHADLDSGRLRLEARTAYRLGEDVALDGLRLASGESRVAGDLVLRRDGLLAGTLRGELTELARWSDLAGRPLGGALSFDATLAAEDGQALRADLRGRDLRLGEDRIGEVRGEARLASLFAAPAGTARLRAENLVVAGIDLARAGLSVRGGGSALDFDVDAQGRGAQAPALAAAGTWTPGPETQEVRLSALRLRAGEAAGRLAAPTRLLLAADGGIALEPAVLEMERGRVSLAGSLRQGRIDARLEASRLPLDLASAFLSAEPAQGTLSGELTVGGTVDRPQAVARFTGRDVGFGFSGAERMDVALDARWAEDVVRLDMDARGGPGATAALRASFPLVAGAGLTVPEDGALRASLVADGNLESIADLLPLSGHRLAGRLHADVRVAGTVGRPLVDGEARLDDGFYQFFETGTVVRNLEARVTARDSRTFEVRARGNDGRRGQVAAEGTIRSGQTGLAYDVAMEMRDFRVVDLDAGTAQAGGDLMLSGLDGTAGLTGRLVIGPAEYDLAGALPGGAVPTMEVVEINRPGTPRPAALPEEPAEAAATPLTVSLSIETGVERLFVRGRGLESVWGGSLVVGGTLSQPVVTGALRADRGTYDFIGRRFVLAESQVVFDGGTGIDPRLDVVAEAQARDLTAQVRVTGNVDAPSIDFTSTPAYPKDEILSRLLFGREVGQLSVAQQIQIARAAASLAGGTGGFDPIGSLRRGLGLDMLELGAGDPEEGGLSPSVSVGKYLDDDTFLRVEEGGRQGGEVSIERQIGRGLSVEAEVGRTGAGGVGLSWRRDY